MMRVQIDVHGPLGGDSSVLIATLLRDPYGKRAWQIRATNEAAWVAARFDYEVGLVLPHERVPGMHERTLACDHRSEMLAQQLLKIGLERSHPTDGEHHIRR